VFFVKKSGKWGGVFFCKKVDLSSTQGALCRPTVSVFFTFYLFGGAYPPNSPPAYGPGTKIEIYPTCIAVLHRGDKFHVRRGSVTAKKTVSQN